ncbi:MAG: tyrosine-type recombinase/integrase [Candidatus Hodarchaeales archaeon]
MSDLTTLPDDIMDHYKWFMEDSDKAEGTIDKYCMILSQIGVPEVSENEIRKYLRPRKLKGKHLKIAALRSFITFLEEENHITPDESYKLLKLFKWKRNNKIKRIKEAIPKQDWNKIIANALNKNKNCKMIIYVLFNFGLRVNEVVHLRIKDIDFEEKVVRIQEHYEPDYWHPKGKIDREVPMTTAQKMALERWIDQLDYPEKQYLFIHTEGNRKGYRVDANAVQRWLREMGLYAHMMRYSYATHMYEETLDIVLVQEMLGHCSPDITTKYLARKKQTTHAIARAAMV